jgi:plastocyanin
MATAKKGGLPKSLIIFGIILIIGLAVFVYLILSQTNGLKNPSMPLSPLSTDTQTTDTNNNDSPFNPETDYIETVNNLNQAAVVLPGTSLVTPDAKVVNEEGQVVQNNALPMTPEAPRLSAPLASSASAPAGAIKLQADANGFTPREFTVKANQPVTIVLSAVGVGSRLVFDDPNLVALEIPVSSGYTMAKTFNAPGTPGAYTFHQDMPGRSGQIGRMIVE